MVTLVTVLLVHMDHKPRNLCMIWDSDTLMLKPIDFVEQFSTNYVSVYSGHVEEVISHSFIRPTDCHGVLPHKAF